MLIKLSNLTLNIDPEAHDIECILLFGSHAYGQVDENSDIDLLIVIDCPPETNLTPYAVSISKSLKIPKAWITLYTKKSFKIQASNGQSFLNCVKKSGKILYSKSDFIYYTFENMPINNKSTLPYHKNKFYVDRIMKKYKNNKISKKEALCKLALYVRKLFVEICFSHNIVEVRKFKASKLCYSFDEVNIPFKFEEYVAFYNLKRAYKNTQKILEPIDGIDCYIEKWYQYYLLLIEQFI